ncbi:TIGR03943 family protein [Streptomyces sp. WMMB 322]|uniref:TIGR03943 family putative permease subunit n=1 Tax=Streptomyces sp. WMMB 322 TaxID=1286821 RepID=UPI0006E2909F|nr:TIGR03943 family protein [Streptomyces sp. WMMB 322]SCK44708.1 putative membrane protein [Streptomyces sp. WMMB 322]
MNRYAQAAVLFLTGVAVLRAGVTDLYLRYVKEGLRPLLLAAGIVLVITAAATVWYELRRLRGQQGSAADEDHERHGGGHGHREPRISWLLVLPLLALILVAPPAPGSYSAMRAGTALQKPPGFPSLPDGSPLRLGVGDYAARAVYDHGRSLGDRRIRMTGFVALDRSGAPYLTRMVLNCCAADAAPVKVGLAGRLPPTLQADTWLEVTGTYSRKRTDDPVNDGVIPYFDVSRARPVKAPADEYEG